MSKLLIRHFLTINPFGWCGSTHLGGARYGRRRVWCALLLHFQRKGEDHGHHEQRRGAEHRREGLLAPQLPYGRCLRRRARRTRPFRLRAEGQRRAFRHGSLCDGCRRQLGRGDRSARRGLGLCRTGRRLRGRQGRRCRPRHREAQDGRRQLRVRRRADRRGGLGRPEGRGHRGQHRDLHERCAHRRFEPQLQGQAATCGREVQRGVRVDCEPRSAWSGPRTRPPWPRAAATSIPTPPHPPPT